MSPKNMLNSKISLEDYAAGVSGYQSKYIALNFDIPEQELKVHIETIPTAHHGTELLKYKIIHGTELLASYVIKRFLNKKNGEFSRRGMGSNPALFEHTILNAYMENGCYVPGPVAYEKDMNLILMDDFGEDTLEERLRGASEYQEEELVGRVFNSLIDFHKVGTKIQKRILTYAPKKVLESRDLEKRTKKYYRVLSGSQDEGKGEEFARNLELITSLLGDEKKARTQIIHGDLTTSHILFIKDEAGIERVGFIDLGSPKISHVSLDYSMLAFAPGINLSIDRAVESYEGTSGERIGITLNREVERKENKLFLYAGLFNCLKMPAGVKGIKTSYPECYEVYKNAHPEYSRMQNYVKKLGQLVDYITQPNDKIEMIEEEIRKIKEIGKRITELIANSNAPQTGIFSSFKAALI